MTIRKLKVTEYDCMMHDPLITIMRVKNIIIFCLLCLLMPRKSSDYNEKKIPASTTCFINSMREKYEAQYFVTESHQKR